MSSWIFVNPTVAGEQVDEKKAEETSDDTFVETVFEEIINDWENNGPFVHRLKAYQTAAGEITLREETTKIENGTMLEMAPFADCGFEAGWKSFAVYSMPDGFIDLQEHRVIMKTATLRVQKSGRGQKVAIANKAIQMKNDASGTSYVFEVKGKKVRYTDSNEGKSKPQSRTEFVHSGPGPMFIGSTINGQKVGWGTTMDFNGSIVECDNEVELHDVKTSQSNSVTVTNVFSGKINSGGGKVYVGGNYTCKGRCTSEDDDCACWCGFVQDTT